jgi:hypothetical protein
MGRRPGFHAFCQNQHCKAWMAARVAAMTKQSIALPMPLFYSVGPY